MIITSDTRVWILLLIIQCPPSRCMITTGQAEMRALIFELWAESLEVAGLLPALMPLPGMG